MKDQGTGDGLDLVRKQKPDDDPFAKTKMPSSCLASHGTSRRACFLGNISVLEFKWLNAMAMELAGRQ